MDEAGSGFGAYATGHDEVLQPASASVGSLLEDLRHPASGTPRRMGKLRGVVEVAQPVCQLGGCLTNLQKVYKSESAWGTLQ